MCGICGEVTFDGSSASTPAVQAMADVMLPRGPDAGGLYAQDRIAFGHRRLKIIDLSNHAAQPMVDSDLRLSIVFNGCIYNYQELRMELQEKGYEFFSHGDTEVILKAYHAWGVDCVKHFHGMFAFAINEHDTGRLVLARDRLGIKPLYLNRTGKKLRFASSLPALLELDDVDTSIDPQGLHHYLTFHSVVPAPLTILKGIRKMPPATVSVFEPDGARKDVTYWEMQVQQRSEDLDLGEDDWNDLVLDALRTAVDRRMVADVPVGVLLSGGVDSSLIVGLLAEGGQKNLNTFSIGFEAAGGEKGDEFEYSDLIANHFKTEHHKLFIKSTGLLDALPEVFRAQSEPMVSHDNVGFFLLSREVAKHVKVVQSGQGADEVFGGYHWYPPLMDSNDPLSDYSKVFFDRDHDEYMSMVNPELVGRDYSKEYVRKHFDKAGADRPVDKALRLDTTVMLVDDPVKRVDNMTMASGLEARVPFLDHELVELAGRVPAELKIRGEGKWILKEVSRRVIPSEVIDRPKGYFPVPALKYIKGPYLNFVKETLNSQKARERELFQPDYVDTLLKDPTNHITPLRGSKLWQVALLEMWLQTHGL